MLKDSHFFDPDASVMSSELDEAAGSGVGMFEISLPDVPFKCLDRTQT